MQRFGLYIIAAFLSFALSSIVSIVDETVSLAIGNPVFENPLPQNYETSFIDDTDAECEISISNNSKNRINKLLGHFSSSSRFRLPVRRISNGYNIVINNGYNAIHNTLHSLIRFTHSRHFSGNEHARYLIRLRKFII